jgi:transketolase
MEGADVTVVSTGYMTPFAQQAARELAEEGLGVDLLHYPSVKPFDADTLVASAGKTGHVVTIETQNILGGLGGAVCEILSERLPTPVKRLGVHDQFGEVATVAYLFEKHGFGVEHLKQACREAGAPA